MRSYLAGVQSVGPVASQGSSGNPDPTGHRTRDAETLDLLRKPP